MVVKKEKRNTKKESKIKEKIKKSSLSAAVAVAVVEKTGATGKKNKQEQEQKKKEKITKKKEENIGGTTGPWKILLYPHLSENSVTFVESENKLVFVVDQRSTKRQIKHAVERAFQVKVEKVTCLLDQKGRKKAFIRLSPESSALDIATRLGMM